MFDYIEDAALREQAIKEHQESLKGLSSNKDTILEEKRKVQEQLQSIQKQWEGYDPENIKSIMQHLESSEEAKLISEGKVDEVLSKRTNNLKQNYEKQLSASEQREQELKNHFDDLRSENKKLKLNGIINNQASKLGVVPSAIDDVMLRASSIFDQDESGQFVSKEADGTIKLGKDGRTPLQPHEWLESMQDKAQHWFAGSSGAGSSGGTGRGGAGGFTLTKEQAKNPQLYRATKEQAEKAGKPFNIVDN